MFPTKIVLAVDGSEESMGAAREAVALSKVPGSELHFVYAEPAVLYGSPEGETYAPDTREELLDTFARFAREALDGLASAALLGEAVIAIIREGCRNGSKKPATRS